MFVVIGASGHVGREAVRLLAASGHEVAAVTRNPAALLPPGADRIVGDTSRLESLSAWPREADGVLVTLRAAGGDVRGLLSLAAAHGAQRVVAVSAATVEHPAGYRRFADDFRALEHAVRASGLAWTFLRCADFMANALAWAPQIRESGVVRGAYGGATTSPIHQRDIAEVAVQALTDPDHAGQAYLLTGPDALDQRDKARLIGEATGEPVTFEEVPGEEVRRTLLAQGMPQDIPERLLGSLAHYAKTPGPSTGTVQQLLGRQALTFASWAAENAHAFTVPPAHESRAADNTRCPAPRT